VYLIVYAYIVIIFLQTVVFIYSALQLQVCSFKSVSLLVHSPTRTFLIWRPQQWRPQTMTMTATAMMRDVNIS